MCQDCSQCPELPELLQHSEPAHAGQPLLPPLCLSLRLLPEMIYNLW